jgi:pimeloyl-ACP methyl ester carboxylesterase
VALLDIGPSPITPDAGDTARVLEALLAAPAAAPPGAFRAHFRSAGLDDALIEWLLLNLRAAADHHRWGIDRAALAALHARTSADDLWSVVEGPRSWTASCVRGAKSVYVTDADARRLEAAGCLVVTIEGGGHFLHVDRPAEVVAAIRAGLAAGRPARSRNSRTTAAPSAPWTVNGRASSADCD